MENIRLKIHQYLVLNNESQTITVDVQYENELLLSVCHILSATNTFSYYYPYSLSLMLDDYFPYIVRNQKYIWGVPISEVTIKEFIDTFPDCLTEGIIIETMMPAAGGRDYLRGRLAWRFIKLFVTSVIPGSSIPVELGELLLDLANLLKSNEVQDHLSPPEFISLMYKRYKEMSERELVEFLGIEDYKAGAVLRDLGYERINGSEKYQLANEKREKMSSLASMLHDFETDCAEKLASGSTEVTFLE